jgi:hypothetical protein
MDPRLRIPGLVVVGEAELGDCNAGYEGKAGCAEPVDESA